MNPLIVLAVLMGTAFITPLLERAGRNIGRTLFILALFFLLFTAGRTAAALLSGAPAIEVSTAGFAPPLSINFRIGVSEAVVWTATALVLAVGGISMMRREKNGAYDRTLLLLVALGTTGFILTRDLFNVFVFLEIASLGIYGLIGRGGDRSLQAGFKFMLAGGIVSVMFLIGTIFLYRLTGTLNIDGMTAAAGKGALEGTAGIAALFFPTLAIIVELKPFPANGWALDAYEEAPSGVGALISSVHAPSVFMVLIKIAPLLGMRLTGVAGGIGLSTFFFANLLGLRQKNEKRMLGYSSAAQTGLAMFAWSVMKTAGVSGTAAAMVIGGLLLTNLLAKAGLFWITGVPNRRHSGGEPGSLSGVPPAALAGVLVFALLGVPPFPSFSPNGNW